MGGNVVQKFFRSLLVSLLVALCVALPVAAVATYISSDSGLEPQLRHIAAEQSLPSTVSGLLKDEPDAVTDVFLTWAGTPALVFNGALALEKHADAARLVLAEYGYEPQFQQVLAEYLIK